MRIEGLGLLGIFMAIFLIPGFIVGALWGILNPGDFGIVFATAIICGVLYLFFLVLEIIIVLFLLSR